MERHIHVLLVDDEERFRETARKILERKGFVVSVADCGSRALESLRTVEPDVVVLDGRLPGLGIEEALSQIAQARPQCRVIVLANHGDPAAARKAFAGGASDYLIKPCDVDILAARIMDAMELEPALHVKERTVADIMIPIDSYASVQRNATVLDGIRKIKESHENLISLGLVVVSGHRAVLVFDQEELVGVLSMRNLIEAIRPEYWGDSDSRMPLAMQYSPLFWNGLFSSQVSRLASMRVEEIMNPCPPIVEATTNLMQAANLLYSENRRRIAVSRNGKIIGVVREQEIFYEISRLMLNMM